MNNTLTYTFPVHSFAEHLSNRRPEKWQSYLDECVAEKFARALRQHRLWINRDVFVDQKMCIAIGETNVGELVPTQMHLITLTFKDEATALLFKLSHEGASA
ncbi:hypothetical protein [Sphingomonas sp. G-3-2-10]|uniref:hypothetical protein n=1 Tax=Sphingomonas sp. G-3-2-10 TaxID=2728838 RepID=UPI00146DA4A4|nr:hypothetical protein [Sphingomonas sp. G-3-2-10]NML04293.1 hypothetical protein [Sphingomonas sp. G-3-2-10]